MRSAPVPDRRPLTAGEVRNMLREHASELLREDREKKAAILAKNGPRRKKRKKPMWLRREGLVQAAIARREAQAPRRYVYVIGSAGHPVKIGIAINPERRLKALQTGCPHRLRLYTAVAVPEGCRARAVELACHKELVDHQTTGEWFDISAYEALEVINSVIRREQHRAAQKQAMVLTQT